MKRVTFSIPWPLSGLETRELLSFTFQTALMSYFGFFLLENIKPGFVTGYMDFTWWLWVAAGLGVLFAAWPWIVPEAQEPTGRRLWRDYLWIGLVTGGTIAVMWYKFSAQGSLGSILGLLCGLLVFSMSFLARHDRYGRSQ